MTVKQKLWVITPIKGSSHYWTALCFCSDCIEDKKGLKTFAAETLKTNLLMGRQYAFEVAPDSQPCEKCSYLEKPHTEKK